MIKKTYDFLYSHGFALMISGLLIILISSSIYFRIRVYGTIYPKIALGFSVAGIVIYVTGRIFVALNQKNARASKRNKPDNKDDL